MSQACFRQVAVCWIIAGPNGAGKTTFALDYLPQIAKCSRFINADLIASPLFKGHVMTTSSTPSPKAQAMLQSLRASVAKCLDRKQKLGHYAVVWRNGRPLLTGADAPKAAG
ncbi:MAG: hypothetical protein V4739_15505 [Pseudomonadota bacterium]